MRRRSPVVLVLAAALLGLSGGEGCKRSHASTTAPEVLAKPPVVKDETEGLLLTWIDDKGDFHLEQRVADVPIMGRDAVRVVDPNRTEPESLDQVFVADLRKARADGTYAVRTMSRVDFEGIAVARREKTGPTLAKTGATEPPESASAASSAAAGAPAARPLVIIYGASWCGACHEAMRYLRQKGIPYVEKDVEKDPAAAREMQEKLARSGLRSGSIPIIDVRGKVMVGFSPAEIDAALGQRM